MATRLEIGNAYRLGLSGTLGIRFLGSVINMTRQILDGGYGSPTAAQTNWATMLAGADKATHETEAKAALEWGLVNNSTLINNLDTVTDSDLDYITAEYAKTYGG